MFSFPGENDRWVKLANREDWAPTKLSRICIKHFQPIYKQGNRNSLLQHLKPVPTIIDPKIEDESAATSHMKAPGWPEEISKRVFQEDE